MVLVDMGLSRRNATDDGSSTLDQTILVNHGTIKARFTIMFLLKASKCSSGILGHFKTRNTF